MTDVDVDVVNEPDAVESVPPPDAPLGPDSGVVDEPDEDVEDDADPAEPIPAVEEEGS
jgi:hypothetical protein